MSISKTIKSCCSIALLAVGLASAPARAGVVDSSDVVIGSKTYTTFLDQQTGLTWLDLDNFWGPTDTTVSVIADLAGSDFHLATTAEVIALASSIGSVSSGSAWTAMATIVGGNYIGNSQDGSDRELLWGIFEDGNGGNTSYAFKYSPINGNFTIGSNLVDPNAVLENQNSNARDLGAWVVSNSVLSVPGPGGLGVLVIGLLLAVSRRR